MLVHDFISKLKVYRVVSVAGGFYYLLMTITAARTRVVPGPVLCTLEALVPYIHLHSVLGFSRERKSQWINTYMGKWIIENLIPELYSLTNPKVTVGKMTTHSSQC